MTRPKIHNKASAWKRRGFIPLISGLDFTQRNRFQRKRRAYVPFIDPYYLLGKNSNEMEVPENKATPRVNLKKSKALLTLEVAVPGFSKEELTIMVRDNILTIRGRKQKTTKV